MVWVLMTETVAPPRWPSTPSGKVSMGTYDGNCRTSTVAVDPFGESERNGRTPLVAATPRTQTET